MTPTITLSRATVEQALEALESLFNWKVDPERGKRCGDAVVALRAALAQQAEPVYWEVRCTAHPKWMRVDKQQFDEYVAHGWEGQRLYTAPPQRKPLPKQDQHCVDVPGYGLVSVRLVRAVERAHGITDPQIADRLARHGIPMPGDPK